MKTQSGEGLLGDRYRVGDLLGTGAMAEVRAAHDERLDRPVAIKILRPELSDAADARRRFEAEARAAASLSHPNIVGVYDVDDEADRPFLVMERLPGRTLADELPLPEAQVIELGLQVTAALAVAHDAGIVHRDVKPGNVLRADDTTWKVADFGIAKTTESVDALTTPGIVMCTPGYVAPERLAGKSARPTSDLYSLGVVLYEALSGRRPFVADTPLGVAHLARTTDPEPLDELCPNVDPRLAAIVMRALARDPRRRFRNATQMRRALRDLQLPTPAAAPAQSARPARTSADRTVRVASPTETRSVPADLIPEPMPRREARPRPDWWTPRTLVIALLLVAAVAVVVVLARSGSGDLPSPVTSGEPTTVSAPSDLPAPLADALDRLEQAVKP